MIKNLILGFVFLMLGGIIGQLIAVMVGAVLALLRCLFKLKFKRCAVAVVVGLIVLYVGIPLVLFAAGTLGDHFGNRMQSVIPVGMVFGFLGGWMWMVFGWMAGTDEEFKA